MNHKILIYSQNPIIQIGLTSCIKKYNANVAIFKTNSLEQTFIEESNFSFDTFIFDVSQFTEINYIKTHLLTFLHGKKIVFLVDSIDYQNLLDFKDVVYVYKNSGELEITKRLRALCKKSKQVFKYKNVTERIRKENKLSEREKQCANLLMNGYSVSQISKKLSLKINTISTYKNRIQKKTKTKNLVQLLNTLYKLEQ